MGMPAGPRGCCSFHTPLPLPCPCRPEASLHSVAQRFLSDLPGVESEDARKAVVEFMPACFAAVGAMAAQFQQAERRWAGGRARVCLVGEADRVEGWLSCHEL